MTRHRSTDRIVAHRSYSSIHDVSSTSFFRHHRRLHRAVDARLVDSSSSAAVVERRPHSSPPARMSTFVPIPGYATTRRTVVQGTGAEVAKGDTVTVHAKGTVAETSKVFWSTKDPGQKPFTYDAGVGAVITGASSRVFRRDPRRLTPTRALCVRFPRRLGSRMSRRQSGRNHRIEHSRARGVRRRWISGVGDSSERHAVVRDRSALRGWEIDARRV